MAFPTEHDQQAQIQRWRLHLQQTPLAVIEWDVEGRVRNWNPAAEQMFGYTASEALGQPIIDLIIPTESDLRERVHAIADNLTLDQEASRVEHENRRKDGSLILCRWFNTPLTDERGNLLGVASMALDVTEIHQATEALRESEQRFRTIFEKAIDGIILLNPDGSFLDMNEAFARMHGWTRAELQSRNIRDLNTPETNAQVSDRIRRLLSGETLKVELDQRHRDGRVFHTEATAGLVSYGGRPAILSFHRDVTERKRAEAAAAKAAMEWNAAMDASPDIVYLLDLDRRLLRANKAFFQITGTTPGTALGRPIVGIMHPGGERVPCPVCRAQEDHQDLQMVMEANHPDNPIRLPLEISLKVVKDEADQPVSLLVTLRDLTPARKEMEARTSLERQLQQAQKMESLGTLAGGIAHDMNNVLGAILGLASAHLERLPPDHPHHRAFETIARAATRGGETVRSLLRFARQSQVEARELDLNDILREEARLLERTTLSRVRLVLDLAPDLRPIRGDGSALAHAVMNLCVNAVDAMSDQGTLTLMTRNAEDGWIEACVQDSGLGMTPDVLERAMDPFFTTKETGKGTGLGLAMVYATVKAHGGQVAIQSTPGRGTTVCLRLPACAHGFEPPPRPESVDGRLRKSLRILVVDDDELIREATEALIQSAGHVPCSVAGGEEALARIEGGFRPDVVFLDLNMPGLGGPGTLPRLCSLVPEVPIFLATGRADQSALDLAERHHCAGLLSKPFTLQELRRKLEAVLT